MKRNTKNHLGNHFHCPFLPLHQRLTLYNGPWQKKKRGDGVLLQWNEQNVCSQREEKHQLNHQKVKLN